MPARRRADPRDAGGGARGHGRGRAGRATSSAGSPTSATAATRCRRSRSRSPACNGRGRSCRTTRAAARSTILGEPWSYPLPPTPIANGSIEGRIEDAQGRLNLNNAALDGTAGDGGTRCAWRSCSPRKVVDPRIARRDRRLDRRAIRRRAPTAPRTTWYAQRSPARWPPTRRSCAPPKIASLRGARPETWAALDADVAALPPGTPLNINTATADVDRRRHSGSRRREARGVHRRARAQAVHDHGGAARAPAARRHDSRRRDVRVRAAATSWSACARARATRSRRRARCSSATDRSWPDGRVADLE